MAFIRTIKRENPFSQIDRYVFESDNRISWKAKGLMGYLLTRPDGWKVNQTDLVKRAKDGKDSIQSAIQELVAAGYVHFYQERGEKGKFGEWIYDVYERPEFNPLYEKELPTSDKPDAENPDADFPDAENPAYSNNKDINNKGINNNKNNNKKDHPLSEDVDGEVPQKEIGGFPPGKEGSDDKIPYQEIINYLNQKTGKKYNPKAEANRKLIRGRYEDGYSKDDFIQVIDNKVRQWKHSPKWEKFLRPSTLFKTTSFDNYLNEGGDHAEIGSDISQYDFTKELEPNF